MLQQTEHTARLEAGSRQGHTSLDGSQYPALFGHQSMVSLHLKLTKEKTAEKMKNATLGCGGGKILSWVKKDYNCKNV